MNLQEKDWWDKAQADENAVILDVRTMDEWNRGIIPGAINIDIYKGQGFIYEVEQLDKDKNYYVYCAAGARSGQACSVLNQLGFKNAYNLMGGISQWSGPVVNPNE
jgi:rhodanese-related sulfurtransferase